MNNLKILKEKEADNYFIRNLNFFKKKNQDREIEKLLTTTKIKAKSILEIGCATGIKLNQYKKILKSKKNYGIDLSDKSINYGKKKYPKLSLFKLSSLDIEKINEQFDLIVCGFFLYLLDRNELFNQFNQIYKKLNPGGYLIIYDFDPSFNHTNNSIHNKRLRSYKMNYDNFLISSGLFKLIFKIKNENHMVKMKNKKNYKSKDISLTLFKKINFENEFPYQI